MRRPSCAGGSGCRDGPKSSSCPKPGMGPAPGGLAAPEGRAPLSAERPRMTASVTPTATCSSSSVTPGSLRTMPMPRSHVRATPASSGWCAWVPASRRRNRHWISPRSTTTCTRPSVCILTTRRNSTPSGTRSPRGRGRTGVGSVKPGSTSTTSIRRATTRGPFRRHIQLAKTVNRPLMIHSRNAWDDTFRLLDEEGLPAHDLSLLHRRPRGGAESTGSRLLPLVQRDRVVQGRR